MNNFKFLQLIVICTGCCCCWLVGWLSLSPPPSSLCSPEVLSLLLMSLTYLGFACYSSCLCEIRHGTCMKCRSRVVLCVRRISVFSHLTVFLKMTSITIRNFIADISQPFLTLVFTWHPSLRLQLWMDHLIHPIVSYRRLSNEADKSLGHAVVLK